jgi:hypothetical protein
MKKIIQLLIVITVIGFACESNHDNQDKIPDGVYTGTFQRQLAFGGGDTSHITLTFSSNTWTGQSDRSKYPALCHGTYRLENQKIIFTNDCAWTAEFDWTLILGGEYDLSFKDNQLSFIRDYRGPSSDTYIDIYNLTKQEK